MPDVNMTPREPDYRAFYEAVAGAADSDAEGIFFAVREELERQEAVGLSTREAVPVAPDAIPYAELKSAFDGYMLAAALSDLSLPIPQWRLSRAVGVLLDKYHPDNQPPDGSPAAQPDPSFSYSGASFSTDNDGDALSANPDFAEFYAGVTKTMGRFLSASGFERAVENESIMSFFGQILELLAKYRPCPVGGYLPAVQRVDELADLMASKPVVAQSNCIYWPTCGCDAFSCVHTPGIPGGQLTVKLLAGFLRDAIGDYRRDREDPDHADGAGENLACRLEGLLRFHAGVPPFIDGEFNG